MLYIDLNYYEDGLSFTKAAKVSGAELAALKEFVVLIEEGADKNMLDSYLSALLNDVAITTQMDPESDSENKSAISDIYYYITSHFKDEITLSHLESRFGINKFAVIREFKSRYNTTPLAFQLQLKLTEAKKMLDMGATFWTPYPSLVFMTSRILYVNLKK